MEVAGDRGVGSWTPSSPFAKPPKAASIDDTLLRLMQAAEIMQPVKGLSPTDPAYLTKREEAMEAFYSDYEKRPVERLLEVEYAQHVAVAKRVMAAKEGAASAGVSAVGVASAAKAPVGVLPSRGVLRPRWEPPVGVLPSRVVSLQPRH